MDFKGQWYCERTFQVLVVLFGIIGFFVGWHQQDFHLTFQFLAAGGSISAVICLPDWPWWNRHPIEWVEAPEDEDEDEEQKAKAKAKAEKKKAKAKAA